MGPAAATNPFTPARSALLAEGVATEFTLGPFDEKQIRRLAEEQIGVRDLDPELVATLFRETRGAPFFAMEVLRYLKDEGRLERIGGAVHLKGAVEAGGLPTQLREAVRRRLSHLPRHDRDILECAAVDGEVFSPSRVSCALEIKRLNLVRALRTLEEVYHLVRLRGESCSFDQAKIREVIYEEIHPDLRREYHAAIAECCVPQIEAGNRGLEVVAAFHFAKARDPRGRAYILAAADRASAASSNLEAAEWYEQYLTLSSEEPTEEVLAAYGSALLYAGRYDRAARVFERLVKHSGDTPRRDEYLRNLAEAEADQHGFERAVPLLDKYRPAGDGLAWAKWAVFRSRYALRTGDVDRAEADVSRALPILEKEGGTRIDIAEAYSVLSFVGEAVGDYDRCIEFGKRALEAAGEEFPLLAMYYNNIGVGFLFRGRFKEASQYLAKGLEVAEARTDLFRVALISSNLGLLHIRWGNTVAAREHLLRGMKFAERIESPFLTGMALDFLGLCAVEEARDEDAAEFFRRSLPATDKGGDKGQMIWLRLHIAMLELERGDPEAALGVATEAYELAALSGDAPEQAMARAIMGGATGVTGDPNVALRLFADAVRGLKLSPAQFEYGEALRMWGDFSADLGKVDDARVRWTQALEVFGKLEAKGRIERIGKRLAALGGPQGGAAAKSASP
jgi:tetratricopeptide (TPR) repeat protein